MVRELEQNKFGECVLCGSNAFLTGEHKIKASLIKQEFNNQTTLFFGKDVSKRPQLAQGPRSKVYHFDTKICGQCNSAASQCADISFDNLHLCMKQRYEEGLELTDIDHRPYYSAPTESELDIFRYFAKILCCYLAEVGGPRPKSIASFAIGRNQQNPVFLRIMRDKHYEGKKIRFGVDGFAEHGGLKFSFDVEKQRVKAIKSSLSIGGVRYEFWVQLNCIVATELQLYYPELVQSAFLNVKT